MAGQREPRYRVLGPLAVSSGEGTPVALRGDLQRRLVAALVLHANRPLATDAAADLLWGDALPDDTSGAVSEAWTGPQVAWKMARGYDGVSLEDLQKAMGNISPPSFYAAFGSKDALFREVVALYRQTMGECVMKALAASPVRAGIRCLPGSRRPGRPRPPSPPARSRR